MKSTHAKVYSSLLFILSIVYAIRTGGKEYDQFIEDERDKLIDLKGIKVSYITFSVGVLGAMPSFAFGQPPLVWKTTISSRRRQPLWGAEAHRHWHTQHRKPSQLKPETPPQTVCPAPFPAGWYHRVA
jgi:hypothetical protein